MVASILYGISRESPVPNPKILHITTVPMSLTFLKGQVSYMKERGMSVHALSSPGDELDAFGDAEGVSVHSVSMTRRITPLRDLIAVMRMWREIRRIRPDIVHAHTPKGGLLGMVSSAVAGTPTRIYQMRGLPFVTMTGIRRSLMKLTERLSCRIARVVICNSNSLRVVAVNDGICPASKMKILRKGSGNGVDATNRFNPDLLSPATRAETRLELGIPKDALVVGFIGRIVREKGIGELEEAWRLLREEFPEARLLLVGPLEDQDPLPPDVISRLRQDPRVHMRGIDWDTPPLYATMDLVVLPTYREGFPNVPLEAAAMGLPVVATDVEGCVDAVEAGKTGLLVPARDADALAEAIRRYLTDPKLRAEHGTAGRQRVMADFGQEKIWEALYREYQECLREIGGKRAYAGKRAFDFSAALLALILLSPVLLTVGALIRMRMGKPILFRQTRPGLHGQPFTMYKFRTMIPARDGEDPVSTDEERLTRLGGFLRRTSLDELPELWNVLRGEMSLVGPRPLLMEYLPLYSPEQARRHDVRPGITGWAQINGRNATTWEKRLELDAWYVENQSFWLDVRILLRTVLKVIVREGINQEGSATMQRFRGSTI